MDFGNRIAIVGNAGGGKTTLARRLGALLDLPVVHVDSIQYLPNWGRTDIAECDAVLDQAASEARWIIDGFGSDDVIARRVERADTLVFVDFPLWRHYWWAAKRQWRSRLGQRAELPENCPEFKISYTKRLIFVMWLVQRQYRPWFQALIHDKRRTGNGIHVRCPKELKDLVESAKGT